MIETTMKFINDQNRNKNNNQVQLLWNKRKYNKNKIYQIEIISTILWRNKLHNYSPIHEVSELFFFFTLVTVLACIFPFVFYIILRFYEEKIQFLSFFIFYKMLGRVLVFVIRCMDVSIYTSINNYQYCMLIFHMQYLGSFTAFYICIYRHTYLYIIF